MPARFERTLVLRSSKAPALVAAALVAGVLGTVPVAVTAVASFAGSPAESLRGSGLDVVSTQPGVRTAVVRGTPSQLLALARRPGVRGLAPDATLRPNGSDSDAPGSVLAWERVGGAAGLAGAGAGVRVALVDTGVADTPALTRASGRLVDAYNSSRERTFADGYGHGTFMAGIVAGGPVAGTGDRGLGVAPGATVLSVKVADSSGETSLSRVVAGLDWVAQNASRVDVASFAFSRSRPGDGYGADPLTDAVERVRDAGVAIVVSAGNTPGEVGDPGFDPRVITVGAADTRTPSVSVAPFSGSAVVAGIRKPDLVGSGVGVLSVLPPSSAIAQANPQSRQSELLWRGSGTSEATAQAAGAAALFLARHPSARAADVKASLRGAAKPLNDATAGAGLLRDATRLVPGTDPSGAPSAGSGEVGFDANSWSANSWSANSWSANSWSANSWSANSWSANSWSANSWSASSWS
ncbi:MAG TPA: S8 family serine peptidase [Frankiaceae bacterium]|nr:S8 family serine peptidase [Frankiaceae bacterium]